MKKHNIQEFMILFIFVITLFIMIISSVNLMGNQQFSELANSFLHNKLYFLEGSHYDAELIDNTCLNSHCYWPLGPFPAIILMPFVFLGKIFGFYFWQEYLNILLLILIFYLLFKISRKINYSEIDSFYWVIAFVIGSMFLAIAIFGSSWYFAHTVSVCLAFFAILEYLSKKRYIFLGLFFGLILLTRATAFLGIIFVVLDILFIEKNNWKIKIKNIIKLMIIPIVCLCILFLYNYARFGNAFDQGYKAQILQQEFMQDKDNYGLFNIAYLPRGIYYSLINMPTPVLSTKTHLLSYPFVKPDHWGMSIFVTSPFLLYLFFMRIRNKKAVILMISSMIIYFSVLLYAFLGYRQFGFRYALDFMPFLFVAFMLIYKDQKQKIGSFLKIFIILSSIFNLYLFIQFI